MHNYMLNLVCPPRKLLNLGVVLCTPTNSTNSEQDKLQNPMPRHILVNSWKLKIKEKSRKQPERNDLLPGTFPRNTNSKPRKAEGRGTLSSAQGSANHGLYVVESFFRSEIKTFSKADSKDLLPADPPLNWLKKVIQTKEMVREGIWSTRKKNKTTEKKYGHIKQTILFLLSFINYISWLKQKLQNHLIPGKDI